MPDREFRDRREAGRILARLLEHYRGRPGVLVLGLPRGGVPVAYEVAQALRAPLDVFLVRKVGVPDQRELAMGAVADGDVVVLNEDVIRALRIPGDVVEQAIEQEKRALAEQQRAYRGDRPAAEAAGRTVIMVDDGLATGASMRAAVLAVRRLRPERVVVAVPAAPEPTCRELAEHVDEVVCARTPDPFVSVGYSYWDFRQVTDEEVRELLKPEPMPTIWLNEAAAIRAEAVPVRDGVPADDLLFDLVGDAYVVLIGQASHGTHEFYEASARMTRRLIEEKGFRAVAVEADWPDAYRVNRFVRGRGEDETAEEALRGFERFPAWMWRNGPVLEFVGWLREHNDRLIGEKIGFYGLDLYSLRRSVHEVLAYLERVDPDAAARARDRYSCLDHNERGIGLDRVCTEALRDQLVDLQRHAAEYVALDAEEELFRAVRNARTVLAAEEYYREMHAGRVSSWNLRDRHMADTLAALADHLGEGAKIVVWAHNSHVGDARATEMSARGEINVGQSAREQYGTGCRLIGFTTFSGTVTAADDWGGPAERKRVRPALQGSVERLFHDAREEQFMVTTVKAQEPLGTVLLERAIGVIYRPQTERPSHYFQARVAQQFDAVIHIDDTRAVEPLERTAGWEEGEPPETYPFAV